MFRATPAVPIRNVLISGMLRSVHRPRAFKAIGTATTQSLHRNKYTEY